MYNVHLLISSATTYVYVYIFDIFQCETLLGEPDRVEKIGSTEIPYPIFLDYLLNLGETRYKKGSFNLRQNNGIHFVDDVSQFVCSIAIPKYLLHLPHIIFET